MQLSLYISRFFMIYSLFRFLKKVDGFRYCEPYTICLTSPKLEGDKAELLFGGHYIAVEIMIVKDLKTLHLWRKL